MRQILAAMLVAASAVAGCRPAGEDGAAAVSKLQAREAEWNEAYATHDAAALAQMYADDAALANPGAPLVNGKDAIAKETAGFASDSNLKVEFASDRVQVAKSGELGYTRGHYTLTMTDPDTGKPQESSGNYLTVWKKQADGTWRAVEDFVTPGPEAASQPD